MSYETRAFLISAGLVVVALCGLVVFWKLTKSLVKVIIWLAALVILAIGAWWLLAQYGILPAPHLPL
jgi:glucan phosphoethanolaminetransferase (alkaline phosphatase superfamily)